MATLIAGATGAWNTNTTWLVAEAGSGAIQNAITASTNTTLAYVASAAFTCTNTDVLVGVLMHCKRVNTTGTVTVGVSDDNGATYTREVTVNASDLPTAQTWVLFKFASTLTADGGSDYKVAIKGSSAGNATFYRNATAGNWAHILATNANPGGAPAAGDILYIAGDWTAAATGSSYTVTMDAVEASIVDHGTLDIGQNGTLSYGTTASTAYYLRCSGDINVWASGTLSIGTTGTPTPSTSTTKLNLDCGSNVQYGLLVKDGGTFNAQGASKTSWTYLASDEAVNSTELTTADSTGWADNDEIAVAPTSATYTQGEKGTLNGAASGTTLTVDGFAGVGGGLAFAHSGTAPTRAEIINLTRNVSIFGASASFQTYLVFSAAATIDIDYAEIYWVGSNTGGKYGVEIQTTTGSCNINGCALHDGAVSGSRFIARTNADLYTVTNCVIYNVVTSGFQNESSDGSNFTVSGLVIIKGEASAATWGLHLRALRGTFGAVNIAGLNNGVFLADEVAPTLPRQTLENWVIHSIGTYGLQFGTENPGNLTVKGLSIWGCPTSAVDVIVNLKDDLIFENCNFFGNTGRGYTQDNSYVITVGPKFIGCMFAGHTALAQGYGFQVPAQFYSKVEFHNCTFGLVTGSYIAHGTADVYFPDDALVDVLFNNCLLNKVPGISTTIFDGMRYGSRIRFQKYQQTAGDHRTYYPTGTDLAVVQTDAVIYRTAAPSERLTPKLANLKLESGPHRKKVNNGATVTFSVWVRKSAAGDAGGADYNGNQPRLRVRRNSAIGIDADATLDTMTAAVGTWEQLTGTTAAATDDGVMEAYVDCDGTGGCWINVDDWT